MSYNFIACDREQQYLMPPSLREWLPEKDLVWFILDAVEQMNLIGFYKKHRSDGWGRAAYNPSMMVSLMLYGYCLGQRSSRKIEWLCERDVGFRVISANKKPDHSTISRFRNKNEKELARLFIEILKLCKAAGLVKVGLVALDGSKMAASASLASNRDLKHIKVEVEKMLSEAAAVDAAEDRQYGKSKRGDELPEELQDRTSRLKRLQECKERLEKAEQAAAAEQRRKIEKREAEEAASGERKRGRKPKKPEEAVNPKVKANITDPQSRIMKTRKGYIQGYNGQAVVTEGQIIIAAELTQDENDVHQLHPMMNRAAENLESIGVKKKIGIGLADAGYWSKENMQAAAEDGPELIIATKNTRKQNKSIKDSPPPRGRIPNGLSECELMQRKLKTKRGQRLYKKRSILPEPVFGQIKDNRNIREFVRRGLDACASEWQIICATHNLLKLFRCNLACEGG